MKPVSFVHQHTLYIMLSSLSPTHSLIASCHPQSVSLGTMAMAASVASGLLPPGRFSCHL
ncbi:hypothetical protein TYRP_018715 [Tyrophagus putrescentiae]|nr:hypothetical protein TYRP_018715 [Tyrophagus putrescentiae]